MKRSDLIAHLVECLEDCEKMPLVEIANAMLDICEEDGMLPPAVHESTGYTDDPLADYVWEREKKKK